MNVEIIHNSEFYLSKIKRVKGIIFLATFLVLLVNIIFLFVSSDKTKLIFLICNILLDILLIIFCFIAYKLTISNYKLLIKILSHNSETFDDEVLVISESSMNIEGLDVYVVKTNTREIYLLSNISEMKIGKKYHFCIVHDFITEFKTI